MQEKCHQYWPTERSARYQYFVVDPMAEYNMPQYILREFKVTDARVGFACQLCIVLPKSCILLLTEGYGLNSRLRRASIYPRPRNRTNCYKSFIHHALLKFQ